MRTKKNSSFFLKKKIEDLNFKPSVLVEPISKILTDAILEGDFKGGDKLVEEDLRKKFGISRTPLREAFRELQKKGLVEIVPRKGTYVKRLTRKDIDHSFPVRAVLEGLAAREAYMTMTEIDLKKIRTALKGMESAARKRDAKTYLDYHVQYHDIYIKASQNEVLIEILDTLRMHTIWHRFYFKYHQENFEKSLNIHRRILKLFETHDCDPDEIEKVVRQHINTGYQRFIKYLTGSGEPETS